MWLLYLNKGWKGVPTYNVSFKAIASPNSLSSRDANNYKENYIKVMNYFNKG
jgi:hypothetical protein